MLVPRRGHWFETCPVQIAIGLECLSPLQVCEITGSPYINNNSLISLFACVSHCTCMGPVDRDETGLYPVALNPMERLTGVIRLSDFAFSLRNDMDTKLLLAVRLGSNWTE